MILHIDDSSHRPVGTLASGAPAGCNGRGPERFVVPAGRIQTYGSTYGVRGLTTGEEFLVAAAEDSPVTLEVLSGRIEIEGGTLVAGETVDLNTPTEVSAAATPAMIETRNPLED